MDIKKIAQSNLLDILNLTQAPKELQQQAIEYAVDIIFESVVYRIKKELPNEALEEYDRLFNNTTSEEKRSAFIHTYIPHFEQIVAEETIRYKYLIENAASSLQ